MYMHKLTQTVLTGHDKAVVETTAGKVRGAVVEGRYIFHGIKYADAERFHLPHDTAPWEGVKEALVYGYNSCQLTTGLAHDEPYVPHYLWPENEHCQYLNIWTGTLDENAKKPVMVWFHGGGWSGGSAVELYAYDGENLSEYGDVVVVNLNHRLGVLGYLDLSNYGEEYKYSGVCGLGDLVWSLKWVKENIAKFGGDPDNVTIMGQSGGGAKVLAMLQTPAADGLFKGAIMQSGGASLKYDPNARKNNQDFADYVVRNLKLTKETIKEIETINWYDFSAAVIKAIWQVRQEGKTPPMWAPVVDNDYFFGNPAISGWRKESLNIPMIIGCNLGESAHKGAFDLPQSKNLYTDEEAAAMIREKYGDKADAIIEGFKKAYPDHRIIDALYTDINQRPNLIEFVKDRAKNATAPAYEYLFAFESDWEGGTTAWHNAEEPFMFHNARYLESAFVPEASDKMEDAMTSAWVNFARTGNPNNDLIPEWKPVEGEGDSSYTMILDRECRLVKDHDKELMAAYPPPGPRVFAGAANNVGFSGADLDLD